MRATRKLRHNAPWTTWICFQGDNLSGPFFSFWFIYRWDVIGFMDYRFQPEMQAIPSRARRWSFKSFLLYCPHPTSPTLCILLLAGAFVKWEQFSSKRPEILYFVCENGRTPQYCATFRRMLKYRFLQEYMSSCDLVITRQRRLFRFTRRAPLVCRCHTARYLSCLDETLLWVSDIPFVGLLLALCIFW